jgi:D-arginine dehydrogenase
MAVDASDFIVIGAGIAGVSVAWRLAAVGRTTLLEAETRAGQHSTGRSVAILDRAYGNETIRTLTAESHAFLQEPGMPVASPILAPRGVLYVAGPTQVDDLQRFYAAIRDLAPSATVRDGAFACAQVPILRCESVSGCVWDPAAADIDVAALQDGWLRDFRRRGGTLAVGAPVTRLEQRGSAWRVITDAGEFAAPVVVNAAGAWADQVAAKAGLAPLGLVPTRRTVAVVAVPDDLSPQHWPLAVDVGEAWYFKGESGRVLVSPADETPVPPSDVLPDDLDVATGIERFEQATTVVVRRVLHRWAGLRSFFPDRTPVLGVDPRVPGFVWCAGLGGYGIQTAPAASAWVAAEACGDPAPFRMQAGHLSPDRFIPRRPKS